MFALSQKAATIRLALEDLKAHEATKTLPCTIAVHPFKVQTTKEFANHGQARQAHRDLKAAAETYAASILRSSITLKENELQYLKACMSKSQWGSQVAGVAGDMRLRLGLPTNLPSAEPITAAQLAASPSSTPTGQAKADECYAFIENGWEDALPSFPMRAISLGDASVQRELTQKLRKLSLKQSKKSEAKDIAMGGTEEEIAANTAPPPLTNATITSIVVKRVSDALKRIESALAANTGSKVESKFCTPQFHSSTNIPSLPRKTFAPSSPPCQEK